MNRRQFLASAAACAVLPATGRAATMRLKAGPVTVRLLPDIEGPTAMLGFNGATPGPEIRAREGGRIAVAFENGIDRGSAIHWHGIHIDNAMDGVPGLTQDAVAPGESFAYDFAVPYPGTYWYHAHHRSWEQVAQGLYGPLIVDERDPPKLDHDITVVLDDWRLTREGALHPSFGDRHDFSHAGRLGNYGRAFFSRDTVRLRRPGPAAADQHRHGADLPGADRRRQRQDRGRGRDAARRPGADRRAGARPCPADRHRARRGRAGHLPPPAPGRALRARHHCRRGRQPRAARRADRALAANRHPDPGPRRGAAADARHAGRRDGRAPRGKRLLGLQRQFRHSGCAVAALRARARRCASPCRTTPRFHTASTSTATISTNSARTARPGRYRDTTLVDARQSRDVLCVFDNPGKWLIHCHTLAHQASGMKTWVEVA